MAKCIRCGVSGLTLRVDEKGRCHSCAAIEEAEAMRKYDLLENEAKSLRRFKEQYQCIPDARQKAAEIMEAANAERTALLQQCERTVADIKEKAAEIISNAESQAADIISRSIAERARIKSACDSMLRSAKKKVSDVLASAADIMQSVEQIESAPQNDRGSNPVYSFTRLSTSAFKRAAKNGFVALDFETTGLKAESNEIIEIGAVRCEFGKITDHLTILVDPKREIPYEASEINGITDDMVAGQPCIKDVLPKLITFIGDMPVIAHNAEFDIRFFEVAARKSKVSVAISYADSLAMSRECYPDAENHKLGTLAEYLSIYTNNLHRADADCELLAQIVIAMLEK